MSTFPYQDRFEVHRTLPEQGRPRDEILGELARPWRRRRTPSGRPGKCSGTMYCGDHDHYDFLNEAFGLFAHVNVAPARHVPELHQVRGRDHRHDPRPPPRRGGRPAPTPAGLVTTGRHRAASPTPCSPTASTPRQQRGVTRPNVIKPETAHPAFDKACHLFGIELRRRAGRPGHHPGRRRLGRPATSTTRPSPSSARPATTATAPSTPSPSSRTSPCEHGVGLHVDGCLGGFILPFGQELGYDIPRLRLPRARASPPSRPTPTSTATP